MYPRILRTSQNEKRIIAPNLAELYRRAAERYEALPAFATRRAELDWIPISFREIYEQGLDLASGLIDLGVAAREHVGLFGDNRVEWIVADYGVQLCGAADVPRGSDTTDAELVRIVNHARIKLAFIETEGLLERFMRFRHELPDLREIVLLDPTAVARSSVRRLSDIRERGARLRAAGDRRVAERITGIRPDDLFTLIYTSGTTGEPKGAMLTHANMMSQIENIPVRIICTDRIVSILPIWHVFERVMEMTAISRGACTYYSSPRKLTQDIGNIEPTFMASAPRLWETIHAGILRTVRQAHPVRRTLFRIACFLGRWHRESISRLKGKQLQLRPQPLWRDLISRLINALRWLLVIPWYGFFNAAVLERVRVNSCGALTVTVSGGGALPIEIDRFFNHIGIPVLEGYGLTETSPVLAVRRLENLVVGTVGPPLPGTDIRIVDPGTGKVLFPDGSHPHGGRGLRGEIHARGPQVMKGYYRQPELTAEVIHDGWLRTGDLGLMTFNDCLKILGRRKTTIVLTSGENVEPEAIEMRIRQSPYIDHVMLVGQEQKFLCALIAPVPSEFQAAGIETESLETLAQHSEARRIVRAEIRRMISTSNGFRRCELIRDFRFVTKPFTIGDELTNLFKIRRQVIEERYAGLIRDMYA